jgi:hypothetical protein
LCAELDGGDFGYITPIVDESEDKPVISTLPTDSINLFDENQIKFYKDNYKIQYVLNYIKERRLDSAINRPDALYISLKDKFQEDRLIIPFKDEHGDIIFYQSRTLFDWDDRPVYLSKVGSDKTLYGIDKVNPELDTVFLFEGPIDSFFVQNGLGIAGISKAKDFTLTKTQKHQMESLRLFQKIWCLDSQWIDQTAREKTSSLLELGECVFIWPKKWGEKYKDLNELCVANGLNQISPEWIRKNSTCGKSAVLKFKMMISKS